MGNETSANLAHFTNEQMRSYQEKYKHLEDTIMTNNEAIRSLLQEKAQLANTVDELRKELAKKDEDTKRRLHDVRNSRKALDSELNKYKSNPEFEAILNLNRDLVDFKTRLDTVVKSNCGMLQMNKDDGEVDRIKRRNAELYRDLKNANVALPGIGERSAELRDAEAELNAKKETVRQEFLQVNTKLFQIKEKMGQGTAKFAGTIENSIGDLRKNLQTYQKKMVGIEQGNSGVNDTLMYEKVKNILLQQQNALMAQIMNSNADPPNLNSPTVQNNLGSNVKVTETDGGEEGNENKIIIFYAPEDVDDKTKAQAILKNLTQLNLDNIKAYRLGKIGERARPMTVVFENKKYVNEVLQSRFSLNNTEFKGIKVVKYKKANENKKLLKNIEADETNPLVAGNRIAGVSGSEEGNEDGEEDKPYKIVLFYVAEDGNDYDKVMAILMELTKMPLINIGVRRIGNKSDAKIRPLVVSFDSQKYVTDALTNRYSLKDTLFKGTKVVKYNNPSQQKETKNDIFPF